MKKILILFLLLVSSCDDLPRNTEISIDEITTDMIALNGRIRAKLLRNERLTNLNDLKIEMYLTRVDQYADPSEKEFQEYIKDKDIQVEVVGLDKNFVVCSRLASLARSICDSAETPSIDLISEDLSFDLKNKVKELLINHES